MRARARHQQGEAGFTLVEVLVAIVILGIALMGLAQLSGAQMVATLHSRERSVAIAYVNQQLESFKSMTYTRIAMDQNPTNGSASPPGSMNGLSNPVYGSGDCGTSTCLYYEKTGVPVGGFTWTVDRWVDNAGSYKTVIVKVTATSGPTFTYSAQTDVSGATTNNPTAVTALQINLEQVDSSGNVVTDPTTGNAEVPPNGFTVTVSSGGTTVGSGTTTDGSWSLDSGLSASTAYTCTVTNPGGSSLSTWVAYSSADASFSCSTGVAGSTTIYTSRWDQEGCTYTSTASTGYLTATVFNTSGSTVTNVQVKLTQKQGQPNPPNLTTGSNGQASWNGTPGANVIQSGLYTVTISGGGVQGQNNLATVCIWPGQTSLISLFGSTPPPKPQANANLTIPVENTYPGGTATLAIEAVDSTQTHKFETQVDVDGCGSSCTATNVTVPVYTNVSYTVSINCVGVGGAAPAGSTDGPTVQDGETLATWTTSNIAGNTNDPTTEAVKCPQS